MHWLKRKTNNTVPTKIESDFICWVIKKCFCKKIITINLTSTCFVTCFNGQNFSCCGVYISFLFKRNPFFYSLSGPLSNFRIQCCPQFAKFSHLPSKTHPAKYCTKHVVKRAHFEMISWDVTVRWYFWCPSEDWWFSKATIPLFLLVKFYALPQGGSIHLH